MEQARRLCAAWLRVACSDLVLSDTVHLASPDNMVGMHGLIRKELDLGLRCVAQPP